jgi:molybdopterin converting factor small subunit
MASVRIPPLLRPEVGGRRELEVEAATVGEALRRLVDEYPSLEERVLPDGELPTFLNLFVDGEDVRFSGGLEAEVKPGSSLLLLPALAGG